MKYMLLVYLEEKALSEEERQICYGESIELTYQLQSNGKYIGANPLHPTATATSVRVRDGKRLVTDGPFAETRELIAGYWIWKVKSIDEAVEWAKRIPFDDDVMSDEEIDIRPIFEAEDFGPELTPELQKLEERLRTKAAKLKANN